jgi:hypothetical protein
MNRRWALAFLLFAACASSSAPKSTMPPASGGGGPATAGGGGAMPGETSCEQSVQHMMDMLTADKPDAPPEAVKSFHDLFVQRCKADSWSADARGCFVHMKTMDEGDNCAKSLTDKQRQALDDATGGPANGPAPAAAVAPSSGMIGQPGAAPGTGSGSTRGGTQRSGGDPEEGGK